MDIIYKYFIYPIQANTGYNLINVTVYTLLSILVLYIFFKILKYYISIDKNFFIAILPFLLLTSTLRALTDVGFFKKDYITVTPGILVLSGLFLLFSLIISILLSNKINKPYWKINFTIGLVVLIPFILLAISKLRNLYGISLILIFFLISFALLNFFLSKIKPDLISGFNKPVILVHMLDASATFVSIEFFNYWEQHPLPRFLISLIGSGAAMYPLKILFILSALYIINQEINSKDLNMYSKIIIFALGSVPAIRDMLRLGMGV